MDFGIKGKSARVCAGSKGLGKGCAMALAGKTVDEVTQQRLKPFPPGVSKTRSSSANCAPVYVRLYMRACICAPVYSVRLYLQRAGVLHLRTEFPHRIPH